MDTNAMEEWRKFEIFKRPEPLGSFEEEKERREREGIKFCGLCGREIKPPDFIKNVKIAGEGGIRIGCRCGGFVTFKGREDEKSNDNDSG